MNFLLLTVRNSVADSVQIGYRVALFSVTEKWWQIDETEGTPWSVAASCDMCRAI